MEKDSASGDRPTAGGASRSLEAGTTDAGDRPTPPRAGALEGTTDGILTVHAGGKVVTFNQRFLDLWNIPAEVARHADNARLISFVLDQLADPGTFLRVTRENQADPDREFFSLLRFNDGRVLERFSRPRHTGEQIVGRVLSFRDVTMRERILQQAHDVVRTREELLSLTQEMPEQTAALSVAAQSLARGVPPAEATELSRAPSAADAPRLAWLVDHLIEAEQLRRGKVRLVLERVDLVDVARNAARRHAEQLVQSGSALAVHADGPVIGWWNRRALEQVASDLVSNAARFGGGRPIEVHLRKQNECGVVAVRDGGAGIPDEVPRRAFDAGERGFIRTSDGKLALGLHRVRTLVEVLGGTVHVESTPGAGTHFEIILPRAGRLRDREVVALFSE